MKVSSSTASSQAHLTAHSMHNGCEHVEQRSALLRLQTAAVSSRRVDVSKQARRVAWRGATCRWVVTGRVLNTRAMIASQMPCAPG